MRLTYNSKILIYKVTTEKQPRVSIGIYDQCDQCGTLLYTYQNCRQSVTFFVDSVHKILLSEKDEDNIMKAHKKLNANEC